MKSGYITDEEIDRITSAIYNNTLTSLYESLSQDLVVDTEGDNIQELLKGQEYAEVEGIEGYVITHLGRVLNTGKPKWISPVMTNTGLYILLRKKRVDFKEFFLDQGWEWDFEKIVKRYKANDWRLQVIERAVDKYKAL